MAGTSVVILILIITLQQHDKRDSLIYVDLPTFHS